MILMPEVSLVAAQTPEHLQGRLIAQTSPEVDDLQSQSRFGEAVDVHEDIIVVGARHYNLSVPSTLFNAGAAYVYQRDNGQWSFADRLTAEHLGSPDAASGDEFGSAVSVHGDTVLIGAPDKDLGTPDSGAVYVYRRNGSSWDFEARLNAEDENGSDIEARAHFGYSVSLQGDLAVIGTPRKTEGGLSNAGAVYLYRRDGGNWSFEAKLTAEDDDGADLQAFAQFGESVSVSGDRVLIGANRRDFSDASDAGAAYVYVLDDGDWTFETMLTAEDNGSSDLEESAWFGADVSLDEQVALIGAPRKDEDSVSSAGAVYLFRFDNGDWIPEAKVTAGDFQGSEIEQNARFGESVAVSDGLAMIAAHRNTEDGLNNAGAAYLFEWDGNDWNVAAKLTAEDNGSSDIESGAEFGADVALSGLTSVAGSPFKDEGEMSAAGVVYVHAAAYTVGGEVIDLAENNSVELLNNEGDNLIVSDDGPFVFPTSLVDGSAYEVTVENQPVGPDQTCTVNNAAGFIDGEDVDDVEVVCVTDQYTVSGTVHGLLGDQVVVQNNDADDQMVTVDGGSFTFSPQDDGTQYVVTVLTDPVGPSQTCSVDNGEGTLAGENVTDVEVHCTTDTFTIGGTLSGLAGEFVVIQNNQADSLMLVSDGSFTFPTAIEDEQDYDVTVFVHPSYPSQTCDVSNGSGTLAASDVTDVEVDCVTEQFTVSGVVQGLEGDQVVLQNNGGDDQTVTTDGGSFTFSAQDDGSDYHVTVLTEPSNPSQTCTVNGASGTLSGAPVDTVEVQCVVDQFHVGGTLSGLAGGLVVLDINGDESLVQTEDGDFTFPTALEDLSSYNVTVMFQPEDPAQTCSVIDGDGAIDGADIDDIEVDCQLDAALSLSTDALTFFADEVGQMPSPESVEITSTGQADLELGELTIDGSDAGQFDVLSDDCSQATLPTDESCSIEIQFLADAEGVFEAQLNIPSNTPDSPDQVELHGMLDVIFHDHFKE